MTHFYYRPYPERVEFGERLRALIDARGWSQNDLARSAGIEKSTISRFVNGWREPTYQVLCQIHSALGCTWEELMGP